MKLLPPLLRHTTSPDPVLQFRAALHPRPGAPLLAASASVPAAARTCALP
eukprot:CAMPEP_0183829888 /NCGR_PEP_ID=MMETSP0807_2-20130328/3685_1 /TAXON_ID=88271 /ORGANISM="Picocystis salinarum, Strain CCMP1897" /LENGTH=49 /DNA_ID= /DNA_START= /DNA_END= /DNA_ORIENTATION=